MTAYQRLLTTSSPTFKFADPGDTISGTIQSIEYQQQRVYGTQDLAFDKDGNPKMHYKIVLQTKLQDKPDDDGVRQIFAKGQMSFAIQNAISGQAQTPQQIQGGKLQVTYTGDGEPSQRGYNPPKLFEARFKPNPNPETVTPTSNITTQTDDWDDDDDGGSVDPDDIF